MTNFKFWGPIHISALTDVLVELPYDIIINSTGLEQPVSESGDFLPRDSYAKRGICRHPVSVCVCVRVCVCLSHSDIVSKRLNVGSRK